VGIEERKVERRRKWQGRGFLLFSPGARDGGRQSSRSVEKKRRYLLLSEDADLRDEEMESKDRKQSWKVPPGSYSLGGVTLLFGGD
jgi:hypothetical protein